VIGLVVVLGLAGWGISQALAVRTIKADAGDQGKNVETAARKIVGEDWQLGNMLTFDGGEFTRQLQEKVPALRTATVKRKWPNIIEIKGTLKQPSLAWSTGNQMYILDKDGTVITSTAGEGLTVPLVYDGSNLPVQIGQRAASAHFIEFVNAVVPAMANNGLTVTRLDIKDTTLDLAATTNKGYRILFDTGRGAGEEIQDLESVLKLLNAQKRTPAEYIDLRISGKAYYK
jgi:cell division septal protein FtsQ